MSRTRLPPLTLEGWYVLHQGFRLAWPILKEMGGGDRRRAAEEFDELVAGWSDPGDDGWSGAYRMVGGDMDYMLVHFRPDLDGLADAERAVQHTALGDLLYLQMDYVSVVELGLYRLTAEVLSELRERGLSPSSEEGREAIDAAAHDHRELEYVQDRLYPRQPEEMPYVCFYPMDKRRESDRNWYTLSLDERNTLMTEHGNIGRRYAGRVSQVISGSVGFDDWEWGVTLFAADPLRFKEIVTEMRYDEVSAEFAEFGPFFVGRRMATDAWSEELT